MKARSLLITAAVSVALAGLAGCDREVEQTAPDNTVVPPPAAAPEPSAPSPSSGELGTVPPAGEGTAAAPAPADTTPSTERTAGQTVDDASVTAKVKAALLAESGVDGSKINVDTFNGRVTLKGELPDKMQIEKAAQIARGIEGVREVDNRLSAGSAS